jgi:hypothetical protein
MFCPKCGSENPDTGKFCRGCGANLGNVLAVVDGNLSEETGLTAKNSPTELFSTGIRNIILGFGFMGVGFFLFMIPPRNGIFWLLMMIPGFVLLASGIGRIIKAEAAKKEAKEINQRALSVNRPVKELPPTQTDYVKPKASIYVTDDLAAQPRSVIENTTRHLKIEDEGETISIPEPKN